MNEAQSGHFERHVMVVEPPLGEGFVPVVRIECPGVTDDCRAWDECMESGCRRPDDETLDRLSDEQPVHGQVHVRISDLGWCVPTSNCWLQTTDASDEADGLDPGRYVFDWRCEDGEYLVLSNVARLDAAGAQ